MSKTATDILLEFPPRLLGPTERALVDEWRRLSDVPLAYVSQRRSDDPNLFGRVVIATGPGTKPSHVVQAVFGLPCWIVISMEPPGRVRQFDTLRDALHSVRPVFPDPRGTRLFAAD